MEQRTQEQNQSHLRVCVCFKQLRSFSVRRSILLSGFSPNWDEERRSEERLEFIVAVFSPFDQKLN